LFAIDIILSFTLIFFVFLLLEYLIDFLQLGNSDQIFSISSNVAESAWYGIQDMFSYERYWWDGGQYTRAALILSSLTVSLWLWLFFITTYIQSLFRPPVKIRNFILEKTNFSKKPATISALILATLLCFILYPYNEFLKRVTIEEYFAPLDQFIDYGENGKIERVTLYMHSGRKGEPVPYHFEGLEEPGPVKDSFLFAALLDRLLVQVSNNNNQYIELVSHVNELGTWAYNLAIAEEYAWPVRDYLERKGISPDRISIISYGEEGALKPYGKRGVHPANTRVVAIVRER
jgi:hypothetical protein